MAVESPPQMRAPPSPTHVTVIGAGVIGLTTALLLQNQPGFQVTVVARATPDPKHMDADPHYTSREAGAVWSSFAGEHELDQQRWEAVSFRALLSLSKYPETGVRRIPSAHLYDSEARPDVRLRGDAPVSAAAATAARAATKPALATPWYSSFVPDFRPLTAHELPKGMVHGYHFTTVTVNPIKYLRWLMDQFETMGGAVKVRTLRHLAEAVHVGDVPSTVVVNCTGYGARTLGGVMDRKVYATRGQTILIKASPSDDSVVMVEDPRVPNLASYIIPRDDGTVILGGTYEPHNANVVPHPETAKGIMERCRAISPSLAKMGESIHVLRHGLRPTRTGGVRIEAETRIIDHRPVQVVHNYGHGAWGYQTSWGTCQYAVDLVVEHVRKVEREKEVLTARL